jgi:hypothetical protein
MSPLIFRLGLAWILIVSASMAAGGGSRLVIPLNGIWQIEESVGADDRPGRFTHNVPVPGLARLAQPAFADVDRFDSRELTKGDALGNNTPRTDHPVLINEYGWLWVNRDGTPTLLTENLYDPILGKGATPAQRFEFNAYYLAALTEYWRAYRQMAGVLHFVYLTSSYPGAFTADHFRDVAKLELEPNFADYVAEAFKPLGVYVNLWRQKLAAGSTEKLPVMLVNDHDRPVEGRLALVLENESGQERLRVAAPFGLDALGQQTLTLALALPAESGRYRLRAIASANPPLPMGNTVCRRKFELVPAAEVPSIRPLAAPKP